MVNYDLDKAEKRWRKRTLFGRRKRSSLSWFILIVLAVYILSHYL